VTTLLVVLWNFRYSYNYDILAAVCWF